MSPEEQALLRAKAQANFSQEQQGSWLNRFGAELGKSPQQALSDNLMRGQMDNFGGQLQSQMVGNGQANQAQGYNALGIQDVAPTAVVGGLAPPMTSPNIPATSGARKVMHKEQQNDQKAQEKAQSEHEKRVRDYMSKREGIALDTQNRMAKLDSIYANQGTDLTPLAQMIDGMGAYSDPSGKMGNVNPVSNMAKQYSQGRMSEQDLIGLKNKLAMQQDKQYGSLTDDSTNMLRMEMMKEQYDASNKLREKLGMTKAVNTKSSPLSGEMVKRSDNITGMSSAVKAMEELTKGGKDQPWNTWISQKTGISDTEFGIHLRNASEYYGRMQSGGAIQKEEDKRFIAALFKPMDTPQIKRQKFEMLNRMLKERAQSIAAGRPTKSLPPALRQVLNDGGDVWAASQDYIKDGENAPDLDFTTKSDDEVAQAYAKFKGRI